MAVEQILAKKIKGRKLYYCIKWEGYDQPTWEPEQNLVHCKEKLKDFKRQRKFECERCSSQFIDRQQWERHQQRHRLLRKKRRITKGSIISDR